MLTDVTVSAIAISLFSKIIQKNTPTAHTGFGIFLHTLQPFQIHTFLPAIAGKTSKLSQITKRIKQQSIRRHTVAASPPDLLVKTLYTFGQVIMNDKTYI